MLEPARTVIEICGGVSAVADMSGRDKSRVHRWGYPKSRGGSGGYIPPEVAEVLLEKAFALGLRAGHFFKATDFAVSECEVLS